MSCYVGNVTLRRGVTFITSVISASILLTHQLTQLSPFCSPWGQLQGTMPFADGDMLSDVPRCIVPWSPCGGASGALWRRVWRVRCYSKSCFLFQNGIIEMPFLRTGKVIMLWETPFYGRGNFHRRRHGHYLVFPLANSL